MKLMASILIAALAVASGVPVIGSQDGALIGKWVAESTNTPNTARIFPQPWGVEFSIFTDGPELSMAAQSGKRFVYELNGAAIKSTSKAHGFLTTQSVKATRVAEGVVIEFQSGKYISTTTLRLSGSRLSITQTGLPGQPVIAATYLRADKMIEGS